MDRSLFTSLNIVELRAQILREISGGSSSEVIISRQIDFLATTYVSYIEQFGIEPYPDMLVYLGWPGQVLHMLFCETAGTWEAFRRMVERSHGLPWRTPLTEGGVVFGSVRERFVNRALVAMSGVTRVEPHPPIPGCPGSMTADFLVTAVTGQTVYIEVAMVSSQADGERPFLAGYRRDLLHKVRLCQKAGFEPVIIWADEVAAPRMLAERLNDICVRLGLPTRPPAPMAWYEEIG